MEAKLIQLNLHDQSFLESFRIFDFPTVADQLEQLAVANKIKLIAYNYACRWDIKFGLILSEKFDFIYREIVIRQRELHDGFREECILNSDQPVFITIQTIESDDA